MLYTQQNVYTKVLIGMTRVFLYVFFSGFAMDNPEEEAARRPSPPRSVALLVSHSRFMRRQRAVEKPTAHLQSSSALSRTARSRRLGQFLRAAEEVGAPSFHIFSNPLFFVL